MKIAILAPSYPTDEEPYRFAFVHARAKSYLAAGEDVRCYHPQDREGGYELDGAAVRHAPATALVPSIQGWGPDMVAVHAPYPQVIQVAERLELPQAVWIHGHEAMIDMNILSLTKGAVRKALRRLKAGWANRSKLRRLRSYLTSSRPVVFVSRWMREEMARVLDVQPERSHVVPNPIDTDLFPYGLDPENIRKGVTLRGLHNHKYGLDVAVRSFAGLDEARLEIYGTGPLEDELEELIRSCGANAVMHRRYVPHRALPGLYAKYGFFVAPSRVEAQGVAMCEAMACGLPVVATNVGGIPEFVRDGVDGFLVPPERPDALRSAVQDLVSDPDRFLQFSTNARSRIQDVCSSSVVVPRELEVLQEAAGA